MAIYTKKEFAARYGIDEKNLYPYFNRTGNVRLVLTKDGMINDQDPINRPFVSKRKVVSEAQEERITKKNKKVVTAGEEEPRLKKSELTLFDQKTKKQIEELEKKIQLYETKIAKANEESIPREHASFLIKNYALGIKNVWVATLRQFMMQKSISLGMTKEEIIELERYITDIVNSAVRSGAEEANKNIRKLAKEYAGKKGRGERK